MNNGCGNSGDGGIRVELKDPIPWTKITFEWYMTGTASCWWFNQGSAYFGYGNLQPFSTTLDSVSRCVNSFELSKYTLQMTACDNATTNFMHGSQKTGDYRSFFSTRRRNSMSSLANINFQLSCNGTGPSNYFILRNIFVW